MHERRVAPAKWRIRGQSNLASNLYIALVAVLIPGCASIISGTQQDIQIGPEGTEIEFHTWDGGQFASFEAGVDPTVTIDRPKMQSLVVLAKKEGLCPRYWLTVPKTNPVTYWNFLIGGLIGMAIDGSSGAATSISPSEFHLEEQGAKPCEI